jgi:hypothetical protein
MNPIPDISPHGWDLMIRPRHLLLVATAARETKKITELIAALARRGPLHLVAGSEWLPAYGLANAIRQNTLEVKQALERVRLARAFTCYQVLDLLAEVRPDKDPLLVLNLLDNFYSPDIPLSVRLRVLNQCSGHLQRLSLSKPVAILIQETPAVEYRQFHSLLAAIADEIIQTGTKPDEFTQPGLF